MQNERREQDPADVTPVREEEWGRAPATAFLFKPDRGGRWFAAPVPRSRVMDIDTQALLPRLDAGHRRRRGGLEGDRSGCRVVCPRLLEQQLQGPRDRERVV